MRDSNRREFLSKSAKSLALASIALQGGFLFATNNSSKGANLGNATQIQTMPKRILGSGKAAMQVSALAYLLAKKPYIVPLFGTTDSKHLREDIGTLDVSFSASEWQNLEAKLDKIEIVGDRYPKEQAQRVGK